jgi:hypothetical protein
MKNILKKEKEKNKNFQNQNNEETENKDKFDEDEIKQNNENNEEDKKQNTNNLSEPINLDEINLSDKYIKKGDGRKEEREIVLDNNNKFSHLDINNEEENELKDQVKEDIENIPEKIPTVESSKQSFNNKIIVNSQSQIQQSFVRNMTITQSNFDINSISSSRKIPPNKFTIIKNNFNIIKKKKEAIKKIDKVNKFSYISNLDAKDQLNNKLNNIDVYKLNKSELTNLENNLQNLLDKVRVRLGNESNDPTMERLLEKYSVLLLDRIEKKKSK